jgi:uncharacterized membrane protein
VAIVATQYSYLPSWLSFTVDQERARQEAETLINRIRVEIADLPPGQRPQLYVFGESLGTFSADSAFTSVEDVSATTDVGNINTAQLVSRTSSQARQHAGWTPATGHT